MSGQDENECFHGRQAGSNCVFCPGGAAISKAEQRAKNGRVAKVAPPPARSPQSKKVQRDEARRRAARLDAEAREAEGLLDHQRAAREKKDEEISRQAERLHDGEPAKVAPPPAVNPADPLEAAGLRTPGEPRGNVDGYRLAAAVAKMAAEEGIELPQPAESARSRDAEETEPSPARFGLLVTLGPKLTGHLAKLVPEEELGSTVEQVALNIIWRWLEHTGRLDSPF